MLGLGYDAELFILAFDHHFLRQIALGHSIGH